VKSPVLDSRLITSMENPRLNEHEIPMDDETINNRVSVQPPQSPPPGVGSQQTMRHVPLPLIDPTQAAMQLSILGSGSDTFQILDGDKKRNDPRLRKILHGTLEQVYPSLVSWQRQGGAVYVCINQTNGRGRKDRDILRVRAYGADLDGAPLSNIGRLRLWPAVVIESSPGRYWAVYPISDMPVIESDEQRELAKKNFDDTQERLAALFGSDPKVINLSRVMRLAGFENKKDPAKPFMARILRWGDPPRYWCYNISYTNQNFQDALIATLEEHGIADPIANRSDKKPSWDPIANISEKKPSTPAQTAKDPIEPPSWSEAEEARVQSMLDIIPGTIIRDEWLNIGRALHWLGWDERGRLLWVAFSSRFPDQFDEAGLNTQWRSFHTEGRDRLIKLGTLIWIAQRFGWKDPNAEVKLEDFFAYLPQNEFLHIPTRALWPKTAVDMKIGPIPTGKDGKTIAASLWLIHNRSVAQMTWAPGEPLLIHDRFIAEGGWFPHPGAKVVNIYRPPTIALGNPDQAGIWLKHVDTVFGEYAQSRSTMPPKRS
jgi:hypothetical protein